MNHSKPNPTVALTGDPFGHLIVADREAAERAQREFKKRMAESRNKWPKRKVKKRAG